MTADAEIHALRREWLRTATRARVAVCDLALDGAEPTATEWSEIESDESIGLYQGTTRDGARQWCALAAAAIEREQERGDTFGRPVGRPVTTGRGVRAGKQVLVRLSTEEHAALLAAADAAGWPLSTWMRVVALRAASR